METTNTTQPNFESVWAILQENAIQIKELRDTQKEISLQMKETDRLLQESKKETDRLLQESKKETDRKIQENDHLLNESKKETDRKIQENDHLLNERKKETDRKIQENDRLLKYFTKRMGSFENNQGAFAEEYFFNAFDKGESNFFGEKFDSIEQNIKVFGKQQDEYDFVFINGKAVGIVETKFKAHENDIPQVLRKAETFRINFPEYKNFTIYLGLASMVFYPELEKECIKNGIAVIKQVGDTIVINDKNIKAY